MTLLATRLYRTMLDASGPRRWWPRDESGPRGGLDEIVIGAVLTQNTAWRNVEQALDGLRAAGLLDLERLAGMRPEAIAPHIRPSGYFNLKARRLAAVARYFAPGSPPSIESRLGELAAMADKPLREQLLGVYGIGPETADSILLYALGRPSFVIDAYTLRIGRRHGLFGDRTGYEEARSWFMRRLKPDLRLYNEYHALLVWIGNRFCRPKPRCGRCPLLRRDCFASAADWRALAGEAPAGRS